MSGLSKSHGVTGWRLGWGCGPTQVIQAMGDLPEQITSGAASVIQQAALSAFVDPETPKRMALGFSKLVETKFGLN